MREPASRIVPFQSEGRGYRRRVVTKGRLDVGSDHTD
jgi:hypothetical protein